MSLWWEEDVDFWVESSKVADKKEQKRRQRLTGATTGAPEEISLPKRSRRCLVEVLYSGGQTGADRAGLEAARELGLETAGWAPAGFQTTAGPDPSLKAFGLRELEGPTLAAMYVARSKRNVDDTDGTVLFRTRPSPGTDKTLGYCLTGRWQRPPKVAPCSPYRPVLVISRLDSAAMEELAAFLAHASIKKLNVAGHRDADPARAWQREVQEFLVRLLATELMSSASLVLPGTGRRCSETT
mmetsp:Transcript_13419/g.53374  ORF Transcript_13419/g.53374 Transcript_13419/m.53374 type:complete len:241 (+) Transcript_13419:72-794(+)